MRGNKCLLRPPSVTVGALPAQLPRCSFLQRSTRLMSRLLRQLLAILFLVVPAYAAKPAGPTARDKELITKAMNVNFDACNRENIDDVMKSCADAMPDRDKFRRETLSTFEEKDIHYSLVECEVLEVRHPWAKARIVQDTHVLDRASRNLDEAAFRNNSALLPKGQRVEYINTFKKENGKWKLYLIISEMREVPLGGKRDTNQAR